MGKKNIKEIKEVSLEEAEKLYNEGIPFHKALAGDPCGKGRK